MLIITLYVYAAISVIWSLDPSAAVDQWTSEGPYVITVALLAPLLLKDFEDARSAFNWTALTGASICLLALAFGDWGNRGLVVYGHEAITSGENIYEFETNPLAVSSLAGTVVVIAAVWLGRPNRIPLRILAAICIPIGIAVIMKTGTRGQLLATGIAVAGGAADRFPVEPSTIDRGLALRGGRRSRDGLVGRYSRPG